MIIPKYCKNVIVGVTYKKKFTWFITSKNIWFMDYSKRYQSWKEWYENMGRSEKRFNYEVGSIEKFCSGRYGIQVVDIGTAELFLSKIEKYKVTLQELKKMYNENENKITYSPSFYVNFDKRKFYSYFPEPENYEKYIPDGWCGYYEQLKKVIPEKYVYWN